MKLAKDFPMAAAAAARPPQAALPSLSAAPGRARASGAGGGASCGRRGGVTPAPTRPRAAARVRQDGFKNHCTSLL